MGRIPPVAAACWALCAAGGVLCLFFPISSRPGYESSLLLSPLLAIAGGLLAVDALFRERAAGAAGRLAAAARRAGAATGVALLAALLPLLAGALVTGSCGLLDGMLFFLAGPAASAAWSGAVALFVACAAQRRRTALLSWGLVMLGSLAVDAAEVGLSVKVNVYDHFWGYFAGPLWDENVSADGRLLLFRGCTLARLLALAPLLAAGTRGGAPLFSPALVLRRARGVAWLAAAALVFAATLRAEAQGGVLASRGAVEARLSTVVKGEGFTLYLPAGAPRAEADRLGRDVLFRGEQLARFFGGGPPRGVRVYFFDDAREMKRLTGTGPTSVAKPWLGELYTLYEPAPHPLLKHELAHLYSARWGRGPLGLPGRLWGILSDTVLLEGTAVAAEWDGDPAPPDLLVAASARAGLLGAWDPFSSAGFFGANRGLSYKAAGAFVGFVRERWGAGALARWYGGEPFARATGTPGREALRLWKKHLESLDVPAGLELDVKRMYAAPPIFSRACPHAVARLYDEAARCAAGGRVGEALARHDAIARLDGGNRLHRLARARLLAGRCMAGKGVAASIAGDGALMAAQPVAAAALLGDIAWAAGDGEEAARRYGEASGKAFDDDDRRSLAVKGWGATLGGEPGALLRRYLVCGRDDEPAGPLARVALLLELTENHPGLRTGWYLLGRAFFNARLFGRAADYLARYLATEPGDAGEPFLDNEALLLRAASLLELPGGPARAAAPLARLDAAADLTPAQRFRLSELHAWRGFLSRTNNFMTPLYRVPGIL